MSIWSWIKNLFGFEKKKAKPEPRFEAKPIDLVMGLDYAISSWNDKSGATWAKITLLKGEFAGVSFKFNRMSLTGETEEQASMEMDYDLIGYGPHHSKEKLENDEEFQNIVFNVAFSLLMAMSLSENDKEEEKDVDDENVGRDNSGASSRE